MISASFQRRLNDKASSDVACDDDINSIPLRHLDKLEHQRLQAVSPQLQNEMAPDRGPGNVDSHNGGQHEPSESSEPLRRRTSTDAAAKVLAARASEPQNFTVRGVLVGLVIGVLICFSNMYFGLQTGWVSSMAMPSALLGFAYFKAVSRYIAYPFTPVENVLIQSVAGAVGTMPLGCGFVGVMPALNYLLTPEEGGPLKIGLWKMTVWAVGIAFFGVVFAVPLRRQVIIREKLKFPSGTATALMIGVLHGDKGDSQIVAQDTTKKDQTEDANTLDNSVGSTELLSPAEEEQMEADLANGEEYGTDIDTRNGWKARIRLLLISFAISGCYVRAAIHFVISLLICASRHSFPISFLRFVISQFSA
jgi:OPT family oligopeptide transporter